MQRNSTSFQTELTAALARAHRRFLLGADPAAGCLNYYQYLAREFLLAEEFEPLFRAEGAARSRGLLVYHAMGMGKTFLALAVAIESPRPVIVIANKSLHSNFTRSYAKLAALLHPPGARRERALARLAAIKYVTFNAHNSADQLVEATRLFAAAGRRAGTTNPGALDGILLIMDEAHHLFRGIINANSDASNARRIHRLIMEAQNLRLMFMTGTPASKHPFELVPCFNMLAGAEILPASFDLFSRLYIGDGKIINRGRLANRLLGLVSHAGYSLPESLRVPGAPPPQIIKALSGQTISVNLALAYQLLAGAPTASLTRELAESFLEQKVFMDLDEIPGREDNFNGAALLAGEAGPAAEQFVREAADPRPLIYITTSPRGLVENESSGKLLLLSSMFELVARLRRSELGQAAELPKDAAIQVVKVLRRPVIRRAGRVFKLWMIEEIARSKKIKAEPMALGLLDANLDRPLRHNRNANWRQLLKDPSISPDDILRVANLDANMSLPIFVDEANGILDGHHRYFRAVQAGEATIPAWRIPEELLDLAEIDVSGPVSGAAARGFPRELPLRVERVAMSPGQFRHYLAAREKEKNEGGGSAGAGPIIRRAPPPLSLPGGEKSGSTYYVKSRMLSNFAPSVADLPTGSALDSAGLSGVSAETLPDSAFGPANSPKAMRLLENLAVAPGPALVYSQFAALGGLAAIARYLDLAGFRRWRPGAEGGAAAESGAAAEGGVAIEGGKSRKRINFVALRARIDAGLPGYTAEELDQIVEVLQMAPKFERSELDMVQKTDLVYRPATAKVATHFVFLHRGQRKLFITELHMLARWPLGGRTGTAGGTVLYAGAAPGFHMVFLSELFPNVKFVLYDPAPFAPQLKGHPQFELHNEFFTDAVAAEWSGRADYFVCDIRLGGANEEAFELQVADDMASQSRWTRTIGAQISMLKFRPPYYAHDGFTYLPGKIIWQCWPPRSSGETRLIVDGRSGTIGPDVPMDVAAYENLCYDHNTTKRFWRRYSDAKVTAAGYCGCWDCRAEAETWAIYLGKNDWRKVSRLMDKLTKRNRQKLIMAESFHGKFTGPHFVSKFLAYMAKWQSEEARSDFIEQRFALSLGRRKPLKGPATEGVSGGAEEGAARGPSQTYAIISGEISPAERQAIIDRHNDLANLRGALLGVLLVTKTGAEGMDFRFGRQVHIFEPYWDKALESQIKARYVRPGHALLPPADRTVQCFLYLAGPSPAVRDGMPEDSWELPVFPSLPRGSTVDESFHARAEKMAEINDDFRELLKTVAIECSLYAAAGVEGLPACRACRPTGALLFHSSPEEDARLGDPCEAMVEQTVVAQEIVHEGETFFFTADPERALGVRIYRPGLEGQPAVELDAGDDLYIEVALKAQGSM